MCVIIHGRCHLTVKILMEQLWPTLRDGKVEFLHCYDFVLRSHTSEPQDRLYILSPQSTSRFGPFRLANAGDLRGCDWAVKESKPPGSRDRCLISIDGSPAFEVTRLTPQLSLPGWMSANRDAMAAFRSTGMTLCRVQFQDGARIERFDPKRPGETTYWMRIAFTPESPTGSAATFHFGPQDSPLFKTRSWEIRSGGLVVSNLCDQLRILEENAALRAGAENARAEIIDNLFHYEGTSTRIEDHRVAVVTGPGFLVLNTIAQGSCGYHALTHVSSTNPPSIARVWVVGTRFDARNDPLLLARMVYKYLQEWALNDRDAKTKEAISAAVGARHKNVSHVVEALIRLNHVKEAESKKGYYYIRSPVLPPEHAFVCALSRSDEIDLRNMDGQIRDYLYGPLPVGGDSAEVSRFEAFPGRIHYDLAYH